MSDLQLTLIILVIVVAFLAVARDILKSHPGDDYTEAEHIIKASGGQFHDVVQMAMVSAHRIITKPKDKTSLNFLDGSYIEFDRRAETYEKGVK